MHFVNPEVNCPSRSQYPTSKSCFKSCTCSRYLQATRSRTHYAVSESLPDTPHKAGMERGRAVYPFISLMGWEIAIIKTAPLQPTSSPLGLSGSERSPFGRRVIGHQSQDYKSRSRVWTRRCCHELGVQFSRGLTRQAQWEASLWGACHGHRSSGNETPHPAQAPPPP
jgi:hypothetical protein